MAHQPVFWFCYYSQNHCSTYFSLESQLDSVSCGWETLSSSNWLPIFLGNMNSSSSEPLPPCHHRKDHVRYRSSIWIIYGQYLNHSQPVLNSWTYTDNLWISNTTNNHLRRSPRRCLWRGPTSESAAPGSSKTPRPRRGLATYGRMGWRKGGNDGKWWKYLELEPQSCH